MNEKMHFYGIKSAGVINHQSQHQKQQRQQAQHSKITHSLLHLIAQYLIDCRPQYFKRNEARQRFNRILYIHNNLYP